MRADVVLQWLAQLQGHQENPLANPAASAHTQLKLGLHMAPSHRRGGPAHTAAHKGNTN